MKISEQIKQRIVDGINALLNEEETAASKSPKTAQQKELDKLFSGRQADAWVNLLADAIKAMTGYRPVTTPPVLRQFSIFVRVYNATISPWVLLSTSGSSGVGLGALANSQYAYDGRYDRPATYKEANAYLATLEEMDSTALTNWIGQYVGNNFIATL